MRSVTPVGGPASKDTVRPPSGLLGTKFSELASETPKNSVRPVSGLSGKKVSETASKTPEDLGPPKMGLNELEMDLEMNT